MRFYKITAAVKGIDKELLEDGEVPRLSRHCRSALNEVLKERTADFNEINDSIFATVSGLDSKEVSVCVIAEDVDKPEDHVSAYFDSIGIKVGKLYTKELTFSGCRALLRRAETMDIIDDDDDIYEQFRLRRLVRGSFSPNFEEKMLKPRSNKDLLSECRRLLTSEDLKAEMDRIRSSKGAVSTKGHPVHYIIRTNDDETYEQTQDVLLESLMKNRRLETKRVCTVSLKENPRPSRTGLEELFRMNLGSVVVFDIDKEVDLEGDQAEEYLNTVDKVCACVRQFRTGVLTVIRLPKECTRIKDYLFEQLGALSFVEIDEKPADIDRAKRHLSLLAQDNGVVVDDRLFSKLSGEETYFAEELGHIYEDWFSEKLKTDVYPQYAEFRTVRTEEAEKGPKGSAFEELMSLVGLDEAKRVIRGAIDYHRIQKYLLSQDTLRERPSYHMLFTGNPGSAKTTVARLFGRIMRENELLSSGHVVEVGRADLVGKFVGHTAPLVKKCFERAKGGVLFIDEAYSLVDDRGGSYGDEAINTIVQEMENRRDSVAVIFAGYPDKMEGFLAKNPGLSSRIAFHVDFPDYSSDELCEIASLIADKKGVRLTDDAMERLYGMFDDARKEGDFGNGRYVRSAIEKAMMAQATRLAAGDLDALSKTDFNTLTAEDIVIPQKARTASEPIGFCA